MITKVERSSVYGSSETLYELHYDFSGIEFDVKVAVNPPDTEKDIATDVTKVPNVIDDKIIRQHSIEFVTKTQDLYRVNE